MLKQGFLASNSVYVCIDHTSTIIDEYFASEVSKYVPDAWIDPKTLEKIGYEIPFTRHFYVYKPLRLLEEIDKDLIANQKEISELQEKVLGE